MVKLGFLDCVGGRSRVALGYGRVLLVQTEKSRHINSYNCSDLESLLFLMREYYESSILALLSSYFLKNNWSRFQLLSLRAWFWEF